MHVKHKEWLRRNVLFCTTLLLCLLTTLYQGSVFLLSVAAQMLMANGRVRAVMYVTLSVFWRNLLILLAACKKCLSRLTPIFMPRSRLALLPSRSIIFEVLSTTLPTAAASRRQRITTLQFFQPLRCPTLTPWPCYRSDFLQHFSPYSLKVPFYLVRQPTMVQLSKQVPIYLNDTFSIHERLATLGHFQCKTILKFLGAIALSMAACDFISDSHSIENVAVWRGA